MPDQETPQATCCENPDPESVKPCQVCKAPTCKNCRSFSGGRPVCQTCREEVEDVVADEKAGASHVTTAVIGGVTGAILGGALWAAVSVLTDYEVGYIALAVGGLAGLGTYVGSGWKKSVTLQIISVACAVLGLILGKYFTVAHVVVTTVEGAEDWSYLDGRILEIFMNNLGSFVSVFDLLWLFLALGIAYRIPAPTKASFSPAKE